jgi:hypothetical protein
MERVELVVAVEEVPPVARSLLVLVDVDDVLPR